MGSEKAGIWTTVEALCVVAGIDYRVSNGRDRAVYLVEGGGHQKTRVAALLRDLLFIDTELLMNSVQPARSIEILEILAVDLDCYEAGESLTSAGFVEAKLDGSYKRR